MKEFIKEFGKDNLIIMISIVGVIILVLLVIVILERRNAKKIINSQLENIKDNTPKEVTRRPIKQEVLEEKEVIEEVLDDTEAVQNNEEIPQNNANEVYYRPTETTAEEAKEKLEEVTKRLIDEEESNSNLIDHTNFEVEQEEKSIISYEELVKAAQDINQKNDKLLRDEDEAAITIEELYRKHEEEQNIIDNKESNTVKVNNPVFEDEPKKFRNSEVISPVFGIYSGKIKPQTALKEMDKTVGQKDLEDEIQRTEDFLSELKKLKNKLD